MLTGRFIGLMAGVLFGIVWMWLGFGAAVLTAFLGLVGWFAGGIISGLMTGDLNGDILRDLLHGHRS
jgi:hypothetical protein